MKLRNIYLLCKENKEGIERIEGESFTSSNRTTHYNVIGWEYARNSLSRLKEIKALENEMNLLTASIPEIYLAFNTKFSVTSDQWSKISRYKNELLNSINVIITLYESMGFANEEKKGIDIKFPPCDDFSDFKKCVDDIDFLITKCPFFQDEKEKLKFETMDVGSIWATFLAVGASTELGSRLLNNVAAFFDKCLIIKSHWNTLKEQELAIEAMKQEQKAKEQALKTVLEIYKYQVDNCISDLEKETGISLKNGEERGMAQKSIEITNDLIDKGLQIYSTIDSPKEVKALFDPIEMKYLDIDPTKLLCKKED